MGPLPSPPPPFLGGVLLLLLLLLPLSPLCLALGAQGPSGRPSEHFLYQVKHECHFSRDGDQVRFLDRYFYDRQEFIQFDSDTGHYEARSPLGEPDAQHWNKDPAILQYENSAVERFCRHNYGIYQPFSRLRRVQPTVSIVPTKHPTLSATGYITLICDVAGFWPLGINVTWFWNGKEEEGAHYLIRNGDWTFQMQVMLDTKPERGDIYTCQVEHATFSSPARVQWEAQSDSARSKMWTGVAGFILGLAFLAPGLLLYLRKKKGQGIPQPSGLMD